MKVTVIGTGYVGLVTGACLSEMGNHVVCLDVDPAKIKILNDGGIPIHEPGLLEVVRRNVAAGRLEFTTDIERSVAHGTIQFIAVGTPPDEDGSADLQYVLAAARNVGRLVTFPGEGEPVTGRIRSVDRAAVTIEVPAHGKTPARTDTLDLATIREGVVQIEFNRPDEESTGEDEEH